MNSLFRKDLSEFKPYEAEESNCSVILNANESFINIGQQLEKQILSTIKEINLNRYPSPTGEKLRSAYGDYSGVDKESIMIGNGSDELISIICNTFVNSGDKVIKFNPDFSMYKIYGVIHGAKVIEYELKDDFSLDIEKYIDFINNEAPKVVFISVPNNPTGGIINKEELLKIVSSVNSIVVIDEAYFEFYGETLINEINKYNNLIVLRTASKIGLAALRLGFLITNSVLLRELYKVKPPYNVNAITQEIGTLLYTNKDLLQANVEAILKEKDLLETALKNLASRFGFNVYPSSTNFILIELKEAKALYEYLESMGVAVRFFGKGRLENCIRVTVGSGVENMVLVKKINDFLGA
ncbi:histidinol-phosphate transaminase [Clostridium manihotivorum]|uniref:Histidinol-phosphate aminotransferase n=1 Tax=Clostridium manihotivorum TaxID=2320868 RepID=A0A410E0V7_9CLOT|nr:histidinol-phosphate transaminase [Clostridium manihotivorum]QAA34980.1 histidinol-phosphate transaminase [Clostridium manihotivorum]